MAGLFREVKHAARALRRAPGFTLVAVLTLALGVGANSAILSLAYGVLLAPLPYPDPDRLVRVFLAGAEFPRFPVSPADFLDYRRESRSFDALAAYTRADLQISDDNRPERLSALRISHEFFDVLGARPAQGRVFEEGDTLGRSRVVILSDGLWRRRFRADPEIVGRQVRLEGESWTVTGVMPPGLHHVGGDYRTSPHGETVDLWWPFDFRDAAKERSQHYLNAVGRLKRGATVRDAEADLNRVMAELAKRYPDSSSGWRVWLMPVEKEIVGAVERPMLLLLAAVAMVLLIACVNLANLLLARAGTRRGEIAVRAALGAGRAALIRFALAETVLIALAGAGAGVLLAIWGLPALTAVMPEDFPRLQNLIPRAWVLAAGALISLLTAMLFGLLPALHAARTDVAESMRGLARHATAARSALRLRGSLVVWEVCLATTLLFGAALLVRSFFELGRADHGFNPAGALTFNISLPGTLYPKPENKARFFEEFLDRVRALDGVVAAGAATALPWTGWNENTGLDIVGDDRAREKSPHARFNAMTPGLARALGIPVRLGRDFTAADRTGAPPVVLVNQAFVRRYLPNRNPVGAELEIWGNKSRIAGVIGDVKDAPADLAAEPAFYWPYAQASFFPTLSVAVRSSRDPLTLVPAIRRELASLDRELPMAEIRTLDSVARSAVALRRFILAIVTLFAALSTALAAVGIYGVLAYSVVERRRELAIRMALGAGRERVLAGVLRYGLTLGGIGLGAGLAIALLASRFVSTLLYGVAERDPLTAVAVAAGTLAIAALASLIPAWRATRVEPIAVLRGE